MNKEFWKAASIRAIKTFAQAALAATGTTTLITAVDWRIVISTAAMSAVISVLTSIAFGLPEVEQKGSDNNEN